MMILSQNSNISIVFIFYNSNSFWYFENHIIKISADVQIPQSIKLSNATRSLTFEVHKYYSISIIIERVLLVINLLVLIEFKMFFFFFCAQNILNL